MNEQMTTVRTAQELLQSFLYLFCGRTTSYYPYKDQTLKIQLHNLETETKRKPVQSQMHRTRGNLAKYFFGKTMRLLWEDHSYHKTFHRITFGYLKGSGVNSATNHDISISSFLGILSCLHLQSGGLYGANDYNSQSHQTL